MIMSEEQWNIFTRKINPKWLAGMAADSIKKGGKEKKKKKAKKKKKEKLWSPGVATKLDYNSQTYPSGEK